MHLALAHPTPISLSLEGLAASHAPCKLLDDLEFDIPKVENVPTLESILNESDESSCAVDEEIVSTTDIVSRTGLQLLHPGDFTETSSISSQESHDSRRKDRAKKPMPAIHGSVLRPSKLKSVSAQLLSATDRVDAGMPTAIVVSSLVAIGTSHGLVLVFDPSQVLKWCLGSTAVGAQYGSVSALSFNRDCSRLLCGFARGQITMWDLTTGKLLRTITDAHPPGTAVLHIKFTDSFVLAVCSDSGGSVFELEFKRLIGVRTCESQCLFSGSRGEVCTIEPLHMNYTIKDHPMQDVMVLAMASFSKVLIVTVRPHLKVMFTHPLKGDPSTLPLLAWQFVIIQVSEKDRVIDPVLAFARDKTIFFYQVICHGPQDIRAVGLQKIEVKYQLLNITWMNARVLVCLDRSEKLHVMDVRSEEELEVIDVSAVQLVYGTSYFKSLATGGNVSQALAFAGDQACYQSVTSHGGQLFLLGTKAVHMFSLRIWTERIAVLKRENKYQEALALCLSFYKGTAKAVIGLSGPQAKRKELVADVMVDLLLEFVDVAIARTPSNGKLEDLEDYYQEIVPVCVDYCLHLSNLDLLFNRIYERFSCDVIAKGTFLECLEPYMQTDRLTSIPPAIMKDFVDHYEMRGLLDSVESCIVHLDITSLDIHQVVGLCWSHGLYDAIIYVYNRGMSDFTTPLEQLLSQLGEALSTGKQLTDVHIKLGNKLLVYISCCLAGRAYPLGDIPEDQVFIVKDQVFRCLTCIHTNSPPADEPPYPYLQILLKYDTREFLNVLSLAFEEEEFNSTEGIQKRQRVVDILLQVMVESLGFTPTQIGILFTFLARQMARHENTIQVNRVLFEQVLEFLANPEDESRHEERQQALMELLQAGGLAQFNEDRLLHLAHTAEFYRVCEYLYEKRRSYDKILTCYLKDLSRRYHVFTYIDSIMQSQSCSIQEKELLQEEALRNLEDLVSIDCKQAAQTVISCLSSGLAEIVTKLKSNKPVLFEFLQGVISYRDAQSSALKPEKNTPLEPEVLELYIDLMCEYRPQDVCNFLKMNEGYRLEEALQIVRKHKAWEATAYLLEKAGDIQGAFIILLENLQSHLKSLSEHLQSPDMDKSAGQVLFSKAETRLFIIVQLCQRNSANFDEAAREALWFPLLEAIMSPQRKLKNTVDKESLDNFKEMTHHVLNSMMGYISPPAILQKIVQDPAYNTGKFGEVKELIIGMLDNYNYEETLMETCKNLLYHDLHVHLRSLTQAASRGFVPRGDQCNLCHQSFTDSLPVETALVFRCGHSYHMACLRAVGSMHVLDGEEVWVCYLCSNTRRARGLTSSRFHRSLSGSGAAAAGKSGVTQKKDRGDSQAILSDPQHLQAFENVRKSMKTPSRLAILTALSKPDSYGGQRPPSGIFQNENFQLKLAAPSPVTLG
ncbi:vacuolar protein sorting-associated protein 8-like protein [Plakobranchus ocellatus]|uniref:Vacuolar protein sorting-associated protein 8-like protein n=1 Tax=Plakobranchus ocellatus TaxID=259542 RepID=A0AAV4DVA0_9GAST|nr:vacuolar protein sorting-associated protein 8-like protein [Plakobranchus ocellatus]